RARTARDRARWEVAGQQWADVSARGHGVSLLNDSKYGYDCQGSTLRLTLIRSPRYPHHAEPMSKTSRRVTDQGPHEFAYALLPHAGTWREAATVRRARELNVPVLVLPGRRDMARPPLLRLDPPGVQVSSIALAERAGDLLIRLYESHGVACRARLQLGLACDEVREVDLDERPGRKFSARGTCVDVPFRAFQIRTLRITPRRAPSAVNEDSHGQ
ncbi:MAG: glycosyl hydrolase-related protein, partial [Vicinamibacterales bacterium]|nr:glycosyl hydrolase-related protein [Vicinamibacterales bacterium]